MKETENRCCPGAKTKERVKQHYRELITGRRGSCCAAPRTIEETIKGRLAEQAGYGQEERSQVPDEAFASSFGCGNPVALAGLEPGQVVLDLGSGAGLDVLLAARKVGPKGRVIGLDMTPEMIEKAWDNARKARVSNVEFRLGEMEEMPVEDESVDWVISNCVVNLSPDKESVFREIFRVLKPGGQALISDIVAEGIPEALRDLLWSSCVGGAMDEASYLAAIEKAGLKDVRVMARFDYDRETIEGFLDSGCAELPWEVKRWIEDHEKDWSVKISSIQVFGRKG